MEISGLGSIYLDTLRDNAALFAPLPAPVHSPEKFEDLLKKTYGSQDAELESETSVKILSGAADGPIDKTDKLYQLCLELETFIVKNLISGMRSTVQKSGLIDEGFAGKIYEDMLYDEYAKEFTKSANFGLAEQAYRQLRRYA